MCVFECRPENTDRLCSVAGALDSEVTRTSRYLLKYELCSLLSVI